MFLDLSPHSLNLRTASALDSLKMPLFLDKPHCTLNSDSLFPRFHCFFSFLSQLLNFGSLQIVLVIDFPCHPILGQLNKFHLLMLYTNLIFVPLHLVLLSCSPLRRCLPLKASKFLFILLVLLLHFKVMSFLLKHAKFLSI